MTSTSVSDREIVEIIAIWFLERNSLTSLGNLRLSPQQYSDDGLKALSKPLAIAIAIVLADTLVFVLFYRCRHYSFCSFPVHIYDLCIHSHVQCNH